MHNTHSEPVEEPDGPPIQQANYDDPPSEEAIVNQSRPAGGSSTEWSQAQVQPDDPRCNSDYHCPNCGEQCSFEHGSNVPDSVPVEGDAVEVHKCLTCDTQLDVTLYDDEDEATTISIR